MIPLFVGYAMIVWLLAARHRRRTGGFAAVAAGVFGLLALNALHTKLNDWTDGDIYLPVLRSITYPYTALVGAVGAFIACLPRRHEVGCRWCGYSLTGLMESDGECICPECGRRQWTGATYRRSGADRGDLRGSDLSSERSAPTDPAHHAEGEDQQRQPPDERPPQGPEHPV